MGLSQLERRTSPENPSTSLSNPAAWLSESLGASPTTSGLSVNETVALRFAACYACINARAKDVAQLPIFVYERTGKDERSPSRDHDVWRVLHDRPNPMMTPMTFKQTLEAHVAGWGNGYAEIEFDRAGRVLNLWPLLPDRTKVVIRNGKKWIATRVSEGSSAGEPIDPKAPEGNGVGKWVGLPSERVLHIPGLGFDGLKGYSVIQMARNAIGAGMAAEEFSARLFANGATPRFALKHPKTLSAEARDRLRLDFSAAYSGLSNAHRTAVLEEGLSIETLGLPAKDAEMIETSRFSIEQMARFFDMPLVRLHSTTAITSWGTGLEQWHRAYLIHTIGPCLVQWEESASWSLFNKDERANYFVEFLREAFLQGDMTAQGAFFTQLFAMGALSPNQIARKLNIPTIGPAGDQRFVPLNYIPLQEAETGGPRFPDPSPSPAPTKDEPTPPPDDSASASAVPSLRHLRSMTYRQRVQDSYRRVYKQVADRVITKHVERSRRAVKKLGEDGNVEAFDRWAHEFFEKERPAVEEAFLPVTLALSETIGTDVLSELGKEPDTNTTRAVERFAQLYVAALAVRETASSANQLVALAREGDTADGTMVERITARLDAWESSRASRVALREPTQASNAVARQVYETSGVRRLMWIAAGSETCDLCQAMNGRIVGIDRPFLNEGESVSGGEDSITMSGKIGAPPLHEGCVCQIVAA
jgi:HK97 family phage portal protein